MKTKFIDIMTNIWEFLYKYKIDCKEKISVKVDKKLPQKVYFM